MRRTNGHTLVEVVLAILLIGMLAGAVGMALSHGSRASVETVTRTDTLSKLRYSVERIAREIRSVRRVPATPTDYDIITRTPTSFAFRRLASDGVTITTVTITISGSQITLAYNSPAGTPVLTNQVNSAAFTYLQADGVTPASSNSNIAFVHFDLVLADNFGNTYPERVRVGLRNRS